MARDNFPPGVQSMGTPNPEMRVVSAGIPRLAIEGGSPGPG
jgi:hypothetical protein